MKLQPKNFDSLKLCFASILEQKVDASYCKHSYLNKGAMLRQHRIKLRESSCNSTRNCWARNRFPADATHYIQKHLSVGIKWLISGIIYSIYSGDVPTLIWRRKYIYIFYRIIYTPNLVKVRFSLVFTRTCFNSTPFTDVPTNICTDTKASSFCNETATVNINSYSWTTENAIFIEKIG